MTNEAFITLVAIFCGLMLAWGFRFLPMAKWQFLASVPLAEESPGIWRGMNLTWYGLLSANAQAMAAAWFMLLTAAQGVHWLAVAGVLIGLCALCLSGSRWLAWLVEKKAHTFTVGGASFLGMLLAPGLFWLANQGLTMAGGKQLPLVCWCSALACSYALGEGLGRLACISFGCCYGKPLAECPPWLARLFSRANFVFRGEHKKIAYASGLEGQRVLPVQAVTAIIYVCAALLGSYCYLQGQYCASLLIAGLTTQVWRLLSELLRADYRGGGRLSAYQWMAVCTALWLGTLTIWLHPVREVVPDLGSGLAALWSAWPLVLLQTIWLATFFYFGRSRVTASQLKFSVLRHLI